MVDAVRLGVDLIEFDMVITADERVIPHDPRISPACCIADAATGAPPAPIRTLTLAQVLAFDSGSRHRASCPDQLPVPGTRMPTLSALLARYAPQAPLLFGEIKMPEPDEGHVDPVALAQLVEAEVRRAGAETRFIMQSSDWRAIDATHAINLGIRTCLPGVHRANTNLLELARKHLATCMLLRLADANATQVNRLHTAGVLVVSDVVDHEAGWRAYLTRGGDARFINDPEKLISIPRSRSSGKNTRVEAAAPYSTPGNPFAGNRASLPVRNPSGSFRCTNGRSRRSQARVSPGRCEIAGKPNGSLRRTPTIDTSRSFTAFLDPAAMPRSRALCATEA